MESGPETARFRASCQRMLSPTTYYSSKKLRLTASNVSSPIPISRRYPMAPRGAMGYLREIGIGEDTFDAVRRNFLDE